MDQCLVRLHQLAEQEQVLQQLHSSCQEDGAIHGGAAKEKLTTGVLAQKLLMMFLVVPEPRTLTMGVASRVIYGSNSNNSYKSKLTEISSALAGFGLLVKVSLQNLEQPGKKASAFQYVGPQVERVDS